MRKALAAALLFAGAATAIAQQPPGFSTYLGTGQAPLMDPFYVAPYPNLVGPSGYTQAACPNTGKVIVSFGQSIWSNSANGSYAVANPTKNLTFNIFDGNCYQTKYAIVGAQTFSVGSALSMLADNLITNDGIANVILVPAMVDSTVVAQWSNQQPGPYYLYNNIAIVARRLTAANLSPTEIHFAEGTTDCANGVSQGAYAASQALVLSGFRSVWASTPILIDEESFSGTSTCPAIQAAQAAALNAGANIFAGANTDSIGVGGRWDNVHFTSASAATAASLLATAVMAH